MSWEQAGAAWGARASDWAALMDPWTMPVYLDVLDELAVEPGDRTVDVGCGSGLASVEFRRRVASVAGLDASSALLEIARMRSPRGDFRVGDMVELPWEADSFDIATSFNGIFGGGEDALAELRRVLRPGGRMGITFWGRFERLDWMRTFVTALIELGPDDGGEGARLLEISRPGAAEAMLDEAGLKPTKRGATEAAQEFADVDAAVRAYTATGPAWAAIEHVGEERWCTRLRELFQPFVTTSGIVRLVNETGWVVGRGQRRYARGRSRAARLAAAPDRAALRSGLGG